mmetsp:Transcript_9355/g.32971  ORF Transcript_9355/g.32971 Transcript_9355/m.32971 type:complete len:234 (+) Transcript_9355:780-1481(+)
MALFFSSVLKIERIAFFLTLLDDPWRHRWFPFAELLCIEPEANLPLAVLRRVASMHDVPADLDCVVSADGAWFSFQWIRDTDDFPGRLDDAISFQRDAHHRSRRDVVHECTVERLGGQILVVFHGEFFGTLEHLESFHGESFLLEASQDLADQTTLHAVRLDHHVAAFGTHRQHRNGTRRAANRSHVPHAVDTDERGPAELARAHGHGRRLHVRGRRRQVRLVRANPTEATRL